MGGKTGTTTQQSSVSIPPEVLARYNAVNARAETTAQQPFTPYSGEFVAPLTATQQAGVSNINQAQGMATPYYNAAGDAMYGGYQAAQPYYGAATSSMMGGQQNANALQGEAYQGINQAYYGAQPYQQAATYGVGEAYAGAQPYQGAASQNINQAYYGAQPYQQAATSGLGQAYAGAQPYQQAATSGLGQAYAGAQPYQEAASQNVNQAYTGAQPYQQAATLGVGEAYAGAQPYQTAASQNVNQAYTGAQPYQQAATLGVGEAYAGAQPYQSAASQNVNRAYAGAQPYQGVATGLGLSAASAVNPESLTGQNINQYMSPYVQDVVATTMANLRQQQQQEQSQLLGNQITSGAFGGDRGRIAQANLARQQELASGQTVAGLMNQGYGQALQTAQQQQGQQLSAEQANRAARASTAQQLAALGQQGFGQGITTAQQQAALGQQGFGQGLAAAQQLAALGQQGFGQGMSVAQQQAALGQQGFGQGMTAAQQLAALGQQGFGQGITTAQQQAALGQQGFGQGVTTAQQLAALGQQGFGQGVTNAQQLAALGQQGFGQGITTAQQQAALGQQGFGQGITTAQQLAALGQQGFGQGMTAAQQQAALGQQAFAQGAQGAQTYQGLGQGLYGMGQEYGKNVAGLGAQAQQTALQGAQAQLGAGTVEQQTQQAKNTADYNQFLQSQGYPFQIAQFLANIAMGTGALSGSSQQGTTTSPQSFFSDRRLKDDIEKIGKTFDGQDIVRYKYKGEPGTRIGLIAQDVEKHHPEAVGLAGGYRTVDYDKATDKAADRGHFASGGLAGGYSSEGGAVMPEMAGMGFAAGGSPDINSMMAEILNSHQGMYPYGKAGLYGQSGGRGGAYGTSQMQTPTRGLMRVDPSAFVRATEQPGVGGQAMQGLNAVERAGSAYTSGSNLLLGSAPTASNPQGSAGLVGRGGEFSLAKSGPASLINRLIGPSESDKPFTQAEIAREPVEDISGGLAGADPVATGGLVRGHYAMGGLPFSEAGGYIPESVLNDNEAEKNKKAMDSFTPKPAGAGQSGSGSGPGLLGGLGQIGGAIKGAEALGSAASSAGSSIAEFLPLLLLKDGGAVPRHGYALDGEVIDAKQNGLAGAGDLNPEVERIRNALSAIESSDRYNIIGRDVVRPGRPTDRAYGRYQVMGQNVGPWTEAAFGQQMEPNEFLNSPKAQDAVVRHRIQQGLERYGNPQDVASVWFTGQPVAQSANSRDVNIGAPEYLRRFQAAYDANNTSAPTPEGRAGLMAAVPSDNTGLGAISKKDMSADRGGDEAVDYRAEVRRALNPEAREAPNWMQRNQDWLVPLLSGVGTMAASPSRYLGAALLQGIGGGAQQYAAMQQRGEEQQRQREQLGVSRATTLVAQQREQVAEQQLREQMVQRVLQSFGNLRGDGTYLNPYNGQLVSPAERMRIATQIASGITPSGTPSRATAPSENAPSRGEGEGAPAVPTTTSGAASTTAPAPGAPSATSTTAPAAGAPAAPSTAPPAAGTPAAPATATPDPLAPPTPQPLPQFMPDFDPQQLLEQARMYERNEAVERARLLRDRVDQIYEGKIIPRDINNQPYYGFQNDTTRQAVLREDVPRIQAGARTHLANYDHVKSSLDNLIALSQNNQMGTASSNLQRVSGIIQTILGENTPAGWSNFTSAVAEGNKEAARLAFSNLALTNMSRGTNMALQEMIMATPGPDMPPQARYNVLTRSQALLQREHEFQNDILSKRPPHMTAAEYQAYWERANPLSRFENTIRQNTPAFVGMDAEQVRQSGAAGRIPDNLQRFRGEGLAFDRETMRWQDPNGNLYNYDGTVYRPRP